MRVRVATGRRSSLFLGLQSSPSHPPILPIYPSLFSSFPSFSSLPLGSLVTFSTFPFFSFTSSFCDISRKKNKVEGLEEDWRSQISKHSIPMLNVKKQKPWKNRQQTSLSWRKIYSVWVVKVGGPSDKILLLSVCVCVYLCLVVWPPTELWRISRGTEVEEHRHGVRQNVGRRVGEGGEVNRSKGKREKNKWRAKVMKTKVL